MSTRLRVPLIIHPTNTVLLDDNRQYMNDLSLVLNDSHPYVLNDDPKKILAYLESYTYQQDALPKLLAKQLFGVNLEELSGFTEVFSVDFSRFQQIFESPDRFKMCATGLIDRRMKKIDGIDFCASIHGRKLCAKMVLFTGETTSEEAVDAFNKKIIDSYMIKTVQPSKLADQINATIDASAWQQFLEISESVTGLLSQTLKPLYEEPFYLKFKKVFDHHEGVEAYMLDSSCSFLIINTAGKVTQLFARNEADFKTCYEIAKDAEAPYDVLQAIRSQQAFPYTRDPMGYTKLKGDAWEDVMVKMEKILGVELCVTEIERPDITVFSFDKYMEEVWPKL